MALVRGRPEGTTARRARAAAAYDAPMTTSPRRARLARAHLQVLLTEALCARPWTEVAAAAVAGGADVLQLREKHLATDELVRRARELVALCRPRGVLVIVNDDARAARDADADGVHLGQEDGPVAAARALLGSGALVGVSTHDERELLRALADGADTVGVGALFATASKGRPVATGSPELLAPLARRAEAAGVPAFGIGGVDAQRIDAVRAAGFTRVAVSAAVCCAADPESAARALCAVLVTRRDAARDASPDATPRRPSST